MKNNALHRLALEILRKAECERTAYDSESAIDDVVEDIDHFFVNMADESLSRRISRFSFDDIAKELIAIGDEQKAKDESHKPRYRVVWETDDCCDGVDAGNNLESAKDEAIGILVSCLTDQQNNEFIALKNGTKTQSELDDDWDRMVFNCSAWVNKLNKETGEYEEFWHPSQTELEKVGYVLRHE